MTRRAARFSASSILLWTFHSFSLVLFAVSLYLDTVIPPAGAVAYLFFLIGLQFWHIHTLRRRQRRTLTDDPPVHPAALSGESSPISESRFFSNN